MKKILLIIIGVLSLFCGYIYCTTSDLEDQMNECEKDIIRYKQENQMLKKSIKNFAVDYDILNTKHIRLKSIYNTLLNSHISKKKRETGSISVINVKTKTNEFNKTVNKNVKLKNTKIKELLNKKKSQYKTNINNINRQIKIYEKACKEKVEEQSYSRTHKMLALSLKQQARSKLTLKKRYLSVLKDASPVKTKKNRRNIDKNFNEIYDKTNQGWMKIKKNKKESSKKKSSDKRKDLYKNKLKKINQDIAKLVDKYNDNKKDYIVHITNKIIKLKKERKVLIDKYNKVKKELKNNE